MEIQTKVLQSLGSSAWGVGLWLWEEPVFVNVLQDVYTIPELKAALPLASCLFQLPGEYTRSGWPHSVALSDVIVERLMLLWQLLITALVLWELSIQHGNNTTRTICQSLSAGDTFPGVWLSITTGSLAMLTCQPSSPYRLIPHKPDSTFTRSSSPPFSSPTFSPAPAKTSHWPSHWHWSISAWTTATKIQKINEYLILSGFSFLPRKVWSIHCAAKVPTKARPCKLLFYTLYLWEKKLQIEETSNREPELFDPTLNAMKLRCIKILGLDLKIE